VTLNDMPAKASHRLARGDHVVASVPPAETPALVAEAIPLRIVYQDEDVIVVDKPPGLTVHPAAGHPRGTLVNALLALCPELAEIKGTLRPGIVHRLDKDTSGLLVAAKNEAAQANVARQLKDRQVHKVYLALVQGRLEPPEGVIDAPIGRHPRAAHGGGGRPAGAHPLSSAGVPARRLLAGGGGTAYGSNAPDPGALRQHRPSGGGR
jgi:23S rRNA pseudouridine1911/1915/1917 synthase